MARYYYELVETGTKEYFDDYETCERTATEVASYILKYTKYDGRHLKGLIYYEENGESRLITKFESSLV